MVTEQTRTVYTKNRETKIISTKKTMRKPQNQMQLQAIKANVYFRSIKKKKEID